MTYPRNSSSPPRIRAKVVSITDGSLLTANVTAFHHNATTRSAASGTLGFGTCEWYYAPTQAETDYNEFAIEFFHSGAVASGVIVQIYPDTLVDALNNISVADVAAQVSGVLYTYDSPTKTELDAGFAALNNISILDVASQVSGVVYNYDALTKIEFDAAIAGLNDISMTEVQIAASGALVDYNAPTSTEFEARTLPSGLYALESSIVPTDLSNLPTVAQFEARTLPSGLYALESSMIPAIDLSDLPTVAEFEARTLPSGNYFKVTDSSTISTASVTQIVNGVFNKTGLTAGGTWDFNTTVKVFAALVVGNIRDKSGSPGVQEVLDPEDRTTVIAEITIDDTTPYRSITIL